jgi:hypothetical protein
MHDALFQFDPPNAPVSNNPARVELRKPAFGRYLVSFPILVSAHGHADAAHRWLSAQPMGSYTVSDAADLIDPDSVEQFALARLRIIRDEPDDNESPILEINTPSSSSTARPASRRLPSEKRQLPTKIFGSVNSNPKPFFPASTADLVSSRSDDPEWRKNAIADLQQERSKLAAARTAAAKTPPGPSKSTEPLPEHAAPPDLKTTVEISPALPKRTEPSLDCAALLEAKPIASPSDRVAQRAQILENIVDLETQLSAATAPPYKPIDDSRSSSGSYALDPSIAPGIVDDERYISKQTPTVRRILKPFASLLHDYGVHGLLQCFVHLGIDTMEDIFVLDLDDLTSTFDTSLTSAFTPGFTATTDHVANVIKSIEYLQHVKTRNLKLDNYLDYTPASTIEYINKSLSHARAQLLATAASAPPPVPAAAPSTPPKAASSSDSNGWMSVLSASQRKRALKKKKLEKEQLEDSFKDDGICYENNDEHKPPPERPSKPAAQSSASPSPAPTTDSGSTSERDSPSSSAEPTNFTCPIHDDLSPTGAANVEKDLAYLDPQPLSLQRILKPFMHKLHSLGVYGQLQNFSYLDLISIESIVALSTEQIDAISAASFSTGYTPRKTERDAISHFIRYIQHSQGSESAPANNFAPIDGNLNDSLAAAAAEAASEAAAAAAAETAAKDQAARQEARALHLERFARFLAGARVRNAARLFTRHARIFISRRRLKHASERILQAQQQMDEALAIQALEESRLYSLDAPGPESVPAPSLLSPAASAAPPPPEALPLVDPEQSVSESDSESSRASAPPFVALPPDSVTCTHCGAAGKLDERCTACRKIVVDRKLRESTLDKQHDLISKVQSPDLRRTLSIVNDPSLVSNEPYRHDDGSITITLDGPTWSQIVSIAPNKYGHYAIGYKSSDLPNPTALSDLGVHRGAVVVKCGSDAKTDPAAIRDDFDCWRDVRTSSITVTLRRLVDDTEDRSSTSSRRATAEPSSSSDASPNGGHIITLTKNRLRDKLKIQFDYNKNTGLTVGRLRHDGIAGLSGKFFVGQRVLTVDDNAYTDPGDLTRYLNSRSADKPIRFHVQSLPGKA